MTTHEQNFQDALDLLWTLQGHLEQAANIASRPGEREWHTALGARIAAVLNGESNRSTTLTDHDIRRFQLRSSRDEELVAEGCCFSDGTVAVRWQREGFPSSMVFWNALEDAERIHTSVGSWRFDWID